MGKFVRRSLNVLFISLILLIIAGCGKGTVVVIPTNTPAILLSPTATSFPTDTPLPKATSVPTNTNTPSPTPEFVVNDMTPATYVATSDLNVRQGPDTKYDIVGKLKKGERVTATGKCENGWYRLDYDGKEAFASGKYLITEEEYTEQNPTPTPNPQDNLDQTITQYAGFTGGAFAIIDVQSGEILYSENKDAQMYPASLTKMMTGLLACENLKLTDIIPLPEASGRWQYETSFVAAGPVTEVIKDPDTWDKYGLDSLMVTLSDAHSQFAGNYVVPFGTEYTVDEMLHALMMMSAADMADAFAWVMGKGSFETFNDMMNAKAKELGMTNSYFDNAVGADDLGKDQALMKQNIYYTEMGKITTTANDLALLARAVMLNPYMREIVNTPKYTMVAREGAKSITFSNGVLPVSKSDTYYSEYFTAMGIKTGYTKLAGQCLALAGRNENGRELVVVYLKNTDAGSSRVNTAKQSIRLLEYAFRKMEQ